jgi:hypothetical protein
MQLRLSDDDGLDTRLAFALRLVALLIAIACIPLLLFASLIALASPMLCAGSCTEGQHFGVMLLMLSPFCWLTAIVAGGMTFASFSGRSFLLTLIAGSVPIIGYLFAYG